jgi:hypothetical protein
MRLDIDVAGAMTAEDASLVERAREALLYTNRNFNGGREIAAAVVWPRHGDHPMRIEFKAIRANGEIGQAYLGPDTPLTEDLFDGHNFTADFREEMEAAFVAFDDYE